MNRRRTILAASGISGLLVAGSGLLAFGSGLVATQPVDRVGSFQLIQARLAPEAGPSSTPPPDTVRATGEESLPSSAPTAVPTAPPSPDPTGEPEIEPPANAHPGSDVAPEKHDDEPAEARGRDD